MLENFQEYIIIASNEISKSIYNDALWISKICKSSSIGQYYIYIYICIYGSRDIKQYIMH